MSEPIVEDAFPTSLRSLEDPAAKMIPMGKGSEETISMNWSKERKDEEKHGKGFEEMKGSDDLKGSGEIDKIMEEMEFPEEGKGPELDEGWEEMKDQEENMGGEHEGPDEIADSEKRKNAGPVNVLEDGERDEGSDEMKDDIIERDDAEGKGNYPGESDTEEGKVNEDDEKNWVWGELTDEAEEEIQKDYVEMVEVQQEREDEMDYGEKEDGEAKEVEEESGARIEGTNEGEEEEIEKDDVEMIQAGDAEDEGKAAEGGDDEEGEKISEDNDVEKEKYSGDEEKKVGARKKTTVPKKKRVRRGTVSSNENKKGEIVVKAEPPKTPAPTSMERPVRERKTVERLVQVVDKGQTKEFLIKKGRGTQLKDIPNVANKLAKKKSADLKLLHQILFGRRGKVINFKNHILQFSGFALHEDEEKQRIKMKEKFEKYVKDILVDFCELFDIHVPKATTRKEDIVAKLVDFMAAPRALTDVILAKKDQQTSKSRNRKRVSSSTGGTSKNSTIKKRAKDEDTTNTKRKRAEELNDEDKEEDEKDDQNELSDENDSTMNALSDENEYPMFSDNDVKKNESDEDIEEADDPPKNRQHVKKTSLGDRRSDKKEKMSNKDEKKNESYEEVGERYDPSKKCEKVKKTSLRDRRSDKKEKMYDKYEKFFESDEEVGEAHEPPMRQQVKKMVLGDWRSDKKDKRSRASPMMVSFKSVTSLAKLPSTKQQAAEGNDSGEKVISMKRKAVDVPATKSGSKPYNKERVTGKRSSTGKAKHEESKQSLPSKNGMRVTICEILKGVDFNTATFNDVFLLLSKSYKVDLSAKKSEIKEMIWEEVAKLAEESAEEEEDEENDDDDSTEIQ